MARIEDRSREDLERYAMVLDRCSFGTPTSACRTLRIVQRHA